ncbi:MAG: branched-chain amino acid ABC transporter permease [Candidatus Acidiferrales bacterium]
MTASVTTARHHSPLLRSAILGVFLLVVSAALPLAGLGPNSIRLLFVTLVWVTASVAWNLLGGFAGQVSFGFAVFYGLGAYGAAIAYNSGLDRFMSILLGACLATVASLLIGLPTFRLKGPYFAIATIGVSEAVRVVMTNLEITGGASGYRLMERGPFNQHLHFYIALGLAGLAVAASMLVRYSKFGLALIAIREDQDAASDLGVNPFRTKLLAHALAAALTGAAGGVFVGYAAFIYPQGVFGFDISVAILLMPTIGGVGTVWGPVVGAVVYGLVQEELIASFPEFHLLLYGALLILIILFEPGGVLGLFHKLYYFVRSRTCIGSHS